MEYEFPEHEQKGISIHLTFEKAFVFDAILDKNEGIDWSWTDADGKTIFDIALDVTEKTKDTAIIQQLLQRETKDTIVTTLKRLAHCTAFWDKIFFIDLYFTYYIFPKLEDLNTDQKKHLAQSANMILSHAGSDTNKEMVEKLKKLLSSCY